MGRIYVIRHGQASMMGADYDVLSETGVMQSRRVGEWLARRGERFDHVVMGGLRRHAQTAEACLQALGTLAAAPTVDRDLDEYDADGMIGRWRPELAERSAMQTWLAQQPHPRQAFQALFAEAFERWTLADAAADYPVTWADFRARAVAAIARVAAVCGSGQNALVFTSGGPITGIVQDLLGIPDARAGGVHFVLYNAGITELLCRRGQVALSYFNAIGPLETEHRRLLTYR